MRRHVWWAGLVIGGMGLGLTGCGWISDEGLGSLCAVGTGCGAGGGAPPSPPASPPTGENYVVTARPASAGAVRITSEPARIDCLNNDNTRGDRCVETFPANSTVRLTATPQAGHRFLRWEGGCDPSTSAVCTIPALSAPVTVRAISEPEGVTPPPPPGSTITWTGGAGTTDWFAPGNWDLGREPASTDDVVIALTGARVTLRVPHGADAQEEIRQLRHSSGVLLVEGTPTCASNPCGLKVNGAVTSAGGGTSIVLSRVALRYGAASSIESVETDGGGGELWGTGASLTRLILGRAQGYLTFRASDVTITQEGTLLGATGLILGSRLTIGAGAIVEARPGPVGADIGGDQASELVVEGTLRAPGDFQYRTNTTVVAGGVHEFWRAAFQGNLVNRGTMRGVGSSQRLEALGDSTTLEEGSQVIVSTADFGPSATIVRGRIEAGQIRVAGGPSSPFEIVDLSRSSIGRVDAGVGAVTIGTTNNANLATFIAFGGPDPITIVTPGGAGTPVFVSIGDLRLTNRVLVGSGVVSAERIEFRGELSGVTLDNILLSIGSSGSSPQSVIDGQGVTGRNRAQIIQRGPLRLGGTRLSPPGGNEARQFYFEHRGVLLLTDTTILRGCISTLGGTTSGTGSIIMEPLDAGQC